MLFCGGRDARSFPPRLCHLNPSISLVSYTSLHNYHGKTAKQQPCIHFNGRRMYTDVAVTHR